jgi:hypothetical protein
MHQTGGQCQQDRWVLILMCPMCLIPREIRHTKIIGIGNHCLELDHIDVTLLAVEEFMVFKS